MLKKEGQKYMQMQGPQGSMQIPVRASHEYLGTVFSQDAENLTLQHRIKHSGGQYAMLRPVILARRVVGMQHRFRIWQAGVLSSACYGLGATGLAVNEKIQLQAMVSRHLRAIASLPAHVTHIPNSEIRDKFQCQDVLQVLHAQVVKRLQQLQELAVQEPTNICVQPVTVTHLQAVELNLRPPPTSTSTMIKEASMVGEQVACPTCGVYFKSLKSMRQHRARKHGEKVERSVTFDPAQHSTGGLPECRACYTVLRLGMPSENTLSKAVAR